MALANANVRPAPVPAGSASASTTALSPTVKDETFSRASVCYTTTHPRRRLPGTRDLRHTMSCTTNVPRRRAARIRRCCAPRCLTMKSPLPCPTAVPRATRTLPQAHLLLTTPRTCHRLHLTRTSSATVHPAITLWLQKALARLQVDALTTSTHALRSTVCRPSSSAAKQCC